MTPPGNRWSSRRPYGYLCNRVETERFERRALAQAEAIAALRSALVGHARNLGVCAEVCEDVQLAVSEALTNVVMHAYLGIEPGEMIVQAWIDDEKYFIVRVLDEGRGLIPRAESPGLQLGLGLMAQLADDLRISNRDGTPGTAVSLRFSLARSQSKSARASLR